MKLRSLEIKGFKSFANPTVVHFDEKVTGIVGPNGSGKSNIVDAFRWVLGEQKTTELRLEQMSDVLFNGSKTKKKANLAEVSLIFENTKNILPIDYHSVKISRKLYRSGESEYLLNDIPCRLKDIHSLLMDTGIGSNSYAIIELGMVDDILQDKENARQKMFEQAAGISKYRKRKKETLQKLKLTEADLLRVDDLLLEIEGNLKDLEKQARRTRKYFRMKDSYKLLSIQYYKGVVESFQQKSEELRKLINNLIQQLSQIQSAIKQKEALLEKEKKKHLDEELALSKNQKEINALLDLIRKRENDRNLLVQKIDFAQNKHIELKNKLERAVPLFKEYEEKIKALKTSHGELIDQNKKAEVESERFQQHLGQIQKRYEEERSLQKQQIKERDLLQQELFAKDKKMAILESEIRNSESEINLLTKNIEDKKTQAKSRIESFKELTNQLEKKQEHFQEIEWAINNKKKEKEEKESKIKAVENEIRHKLKKIDALENEHILLKNMIEKMEGYPAAVKYILKSDYSGYSLFSDLLRIDPDYKEAVEQYLSPFLDYLVIKDRKEGEELIQLLKENQKGKISCFVLDAYETSANFHIPGLKPLREFVDIETGLDQLVDLLLENVFVAQNDQIEVSEILKSNPKIKIITKDGSTIHNSFSISGGSTDLFGVTKIGRKQRLDDISKAKESNSKQLKKLEDHVTNLQESLHKLDILAEEKKRDKIRNEILDLDKNASLIQSQIEISESEIKNSSSRIQSLTSAIELNQNQIQQLKDEKQIQKSRIELFRDNAKDLDQSVEDLLFQIEKWRKLERDQKIKLIEIQSEIKACAKELDYFNNRLLVLSKEQEKATLELHELKQSLVNSEDMYQKIEEELEKDYELREEKQKTLNLKEQEYFESRSKINKLENELAESNREVLSMQHKINLLKDEEKEVRFKENNIYERVKLEFKIEKKEFVELDIEMNGKSQQDLELEIDRIKNKLENFGDINPLALEAFDEMKARYEDIAEQKNDIVEAKTSLLNTIDEIEETAKILYLEAFEKVRKHFVVVFRSLFTQDDNCDLILLNPEDPLNSKIDIIAKPKGKRPLSLSQLSGGEKTLTATAILFSLYLLKPAPFCIFDEVDAPLDDQNIFKFANIIRTFSDQSQFIIVTHNKSTMTEVDILYGVYMQEKGISSLSGVDFRSYQDDHKVYEKYNYV